MVDGGVVDGGRRLPVLALLAFLVSTRLALLADGWLTAGGVVGLGPLVDGPWVWGSPAVCGWLGSFAGGRYTFEEH